MNYLLWSIPLLIIPASLLSFRFLPFPGARRYCYGGVLAVAFFLNFFRVSFWNETVDTIELLCVNFILAEFFWMFFLKVKNRRIFTALFVIALCAYGFEFRHWLAAGTAHARELWSTPAASAYTRGRDRYVVREHVLYAAERPSRQIILSKRLGGWLLEKQIKSYRTPRGFGNVGITYTWSETGEGVRLDLHAAGYKLWTMGEGY